MITSLSQLTMRRYIDLVCGNTSVLHNKDEVLTPAKIQELRGLLMYEYAALSNEAAARSFISRRSKRERLKSELLLFQVCNNLFALQAFDELREILSDYGVNASSMNDRQLYDEIERQIIRAKRERKRLNSDTEQDNKEEPSPEEIRRSFDRQTASLMTYFKFQIDLNKIPASQYACMIDQANKEIKAKLRAANKR